jgi:hypothetical protein
MIELTFEVTLRHAGDDGEPSPTAEQIEEAIRFANTGGDRLWHAWGVPGLTVEVDAL